MNIIRNIYNKICRKPLLVIPVISTSFYGWVDVNERLPEPMMVGGTFSFDLLTYSKVGSYYVKAYDFELKCWTDSNYIIITHWRKLPDFPDQVG